MLYVLTRKLSIQSRYVSLLTKICLKHRTFIRMTILSTAVPFVVLQNRKLKLIQATNYNTYKLAEFLVPKLS